MRCLLSVLLLAMCVTAARAQGDLTAERASLRGIETFVVDVTIEGPEHLARSDQLRTDVVVHRVVSRLRNAGLRVQDAAPERNGVPNLHVHVNLLELEGGLIPFSIDADFYQQVRLQLSGREMASSTWDESVLGLVSGGLVETIPRSVDSLVDQFIDDYRSANE